MTTYHKLYVVSLNGAPSVSLVFGLQFEHNREKPLKSRCVLHSTIATSFQLKVAAFKCVVDFFLLYECLLVRPQLRSKESFTVRVNGVILKTPSTAHRLSPQARQTTWSWSFSSGTQLGWWQIDLAEVAAKKPPERSLCRIEIKPNITRSKDLRTL